MLEIASLVLAIVGIAFAFERPRNAFLRLFCARYGTNERLDASNRSISPQIAATPIFGATQSGRHPFFIEKPSSSIREARERSRETQKPVFLVIYDEDHPSKSQLYYSLGCFMDYFTTKRLVQDHFVAALVPATDDDAPALIPADNPLENCLLVVMRPDGSVIRSEGVYANADEGLKRVRAVIALPASA
jgi:hypothetical protein